MEEIKGTLAQNATNEFRTWGRLFRQGPGSFLFASAFGVGLGVILAKGIIIPIMRNEEKKKNMKVLRLRIEEKRKNMKVGNRKTYA